MFTKCLLNIVNTAVHLPFIASMSAADSVHLPSLYQRIFRHPKLHILDVTNGLSRWQRPIPFCSFLFSLTSFALWLSFTLDRGPLLIPWLVRVGSVSCGSAALCVSQEALLVIFSSLNKRNWLPARKDHKIMTRPVGELPLVTYQWLPVVRLPLLSR